MISEDVIKIEYIVFRLVEEMYKQMRSARMRDGSTIRHFIDEAIAYELNMGFRPDYFTK